MKIYTKTGDKGETSLFGGAKLSKNDLRIEAYGTVDELNSVLGCALSFLQNAELQTPIQNLQKELFVLGAELASPQANEKMKAGFLQKSHITAQELWIDEMEAKLSPLKQFILPGGSKSASFLHLARTVCRRAERIVVELSGKEEIRPEVIMYLNRLSDLCFVLARFINQTQGESDILWEGIL